MNDSREKTLVRISFLGAEGVKKSDLFSYFTGQSRDKTEPLYPEFKHTDVSGFRVQWNDIPGNLKYRDTLASRTYVGTENIIILTYNVTNSDSFEQLLKIQKEFEQQCQPPAELILVGIKTTETCGISEKAQRYAAENGMPYFEVFIRQDTGAPDANEIQALQQHLNQSVENYPRRIQLHQTEKSKQALKEKINNFRNEHVTNENIKAIADLLEQAVDDNFTLDIEKQIDKNLWKLQQTSKSILNSVVNMCASVIREIYYIRQTLSELVFKPQQAERKRPFMFWSTYGEKQQAQSLIEEVKSSKGPK